MASESDRTYKPASVATIVYRVTETEEPRWIDVNGVPNVKSPVTAKSLTLRPKTGRLRSRRRQDLLRQSPLGRVGGRRRFRLDG